MQLWSQIDKKNGLLCQGNDFKFFFQKPKKKEKKNAEKILRTESKTNIMDISSPFSPNQRPHFQNSFP